MSKLVKDIITRELASRYSTTTNAVWVELTRLDGIATNQLRRELRSRHMRLELVKTSLLRRACAGGPLAKLADALEGPAALLTGGESAVDIAKMLDEWWPKLPRNTLKVHGALLEGEYLDEERVKNLSRMPGKRDLQARLVSIALSPGANLVSAILSGGGNIAGCLKSIIEKLEKTEAAATNGAASDN